MNGKPSKGDRARQRVLEAVIEAVGREGLASLSVAEIGGAVGMSSGHVLYYFGTKDTLFVEALKHIEQRLDLDRAALLAARSPALRRLHRYLALYLPTSSSDARWVLWVEVWNRSLTDPELRVIQLELDGRWQRDLAELVTAGVAAGEFHPADPAAAAEAIAALLDGLAIRMLTGPPVASAARIRRIAEQYCATALGVGG
jgi:AcrR family transcriptional regulator